MSSGGRIPGAGQGAPLFPDPRPATTDPAVQRPATRDPRPALLVVTLGRRRYAEVLELQRPVARARISGAVDQDVLLLVEHEPVVTLGRSSKEGHLVASPALLQARGVELFEVERGGDVTFHGPGQLVGYPIVDLKRHRKDLHWYLRQVEEALIRGLAPFGIQGTRNEGYTGVWVERDVSWPDHGPRKIASIGVHARDWVTWHGFALNVETDLTFFDLIVPCGIQGVTMTSVRREAGALMAGSAPGAPLMERVAAAVIGGLAAVFGLEAAACALDSLELAAPL